MIAMLVAALWQASAVLPADSGESHLKNIRQITFGGQNAEAYFSASGDRIILQRTENDSGGCDQEYVVNVDGTGLHRVSSGAGRTTCGYFFDRDRRIFYYSTEHLGPACPPRPDYSLGYVWALYDYDLYVADSSGRGARRITTNPLYDAEGTLSPDGRTIVFTSLQGGDLNIYTMRLDGTHLKKLTHTLGYDGGPFFSPDGKHIVYRAAHPQTARDSSDYLDLLKRNLVRPTFMEIWVMDADGRNQHQVTKLGGANFAPYFHPDGRRIVFASNHKNPRSRNFDLYLIGMDGTGLEQVTTDAEFDAFPQFSPDGRRLVWASNRHGSVPGETNIFIADWVERP
jgi:Tol biopolymer transport system component